MGDRAVGRTTGPFRERLHLHQHRASLQSFKAIVVIQSVIVDTEIVTAAAARALIAKVRCVTHRVFQQRGKMVKVDADVLSLSRLFGHRVASILMCASPAVTDDLYRRKEEEASPMVLGHRLPPGVHRKVTVNW